MSVLASTENPFGGVIPAPDGLDSDPEIFTKQLADSLLKWRDDGYRVVWLEISLERAPLIPIAVAAGFQFHHTGVDYLMLTFQLEAGAFVPAHASHYIGAGGVAINERDELLVVSERYHRDTSRPPRYKLPGGALHEGEHLAEAVVREVLEETGVETVFDALVCFRHWHGYRYGKSDIYFVCRLRPTSEKITIQEEEIADSRWMPVEAYLADEHVSDFNKQIVMAAQRHPGIVPTPLEGYGDPARFEFFLPPDQT
ncbi:MAG: NUDIX domain-containing protein [Gemmatimonadetes bacterium]|jgi:8-oxo-dGTP diphosphatase|nr:NUDIX domain-containing protein [Gemmatimonadota bacterium]MBT6145586.1 NUDIX domain-containing protein [Gemmatimonadota bacterium]MBT7863505.1 NUDIX domain-containing protein [Gemmatimonadota bacterium]